MSRRKALATELPVRHAGVAQRYGASGALAATPAASTALGAVGSVCAALPSLLEVAREAHGLPPRDAMLVFSVVDPLALEAERARVRRLETDLTASFGASVRVFGLVSTPCACEDTAAHPRILRVTDPRLAARLASEAPATWLVRPDGVVAFVGASSGVEAFLATFLSKRPIDHSKNWKQEQPACP
jgi:hypothetical protein